MTKLYTVTFEVEYVIAVEDDEDQQEVAASTVRDVVYDISTRDLNPLVQEMTSLPEGWDDSCYPYGRYGSEFTIKEIIEDSKND